MKNWSTVTLGSASFLAVASLFSQILGFLRDKLLSYVYGASLELDAYYASFRVPEFMYLSVGSFVSSAILVPLFAKKLKEDDSRIWFQKLFTTFAIFFILIYGVIVLVLPQIISKLYSHTAGDFQHSIVIYGSVLLVSTFFLSMSSIVSSVAQERKDFLHVGIAPVFYNLGTVLGIVVLRPFWGIMGVCIGVVLGSAMHLLVQLPEVRKLKLFQGYGHFVFRAFSLKLLGFTLSKSVLRTLSLVASAVTFFLLTYFASLYEAGSITIISIAFTLQTVPHTLAGVSYATVVLPLLSDAYVSKNEALFDGILRKGFKKMLLISFILTGAIIIFQNEIVYILFGGGKFSLDAVLETGLALGLFSLSLYPQNAILLLSRASYAKYDYILPLVTNICTAALTYVFARYAFVSGGMLSTILSIPIAYTFAQYISLLVAIYIHQRNKEIPKMYIPAGYTLAVLSIVIINSFTMRYVLELILEKSSSLAEHIIFAAFIFISYMVFSYVLLGMVKDEHIKEHRHYFKNKIKNILLALLPKRG